MRILLIEDHPIVRAACRRLLSSSGGTEIAEAATAAIGLSMARDVAPDVIILDLRLPDGNGLDLLVALLSEDSGRRIIVFSMYEDSTFAKRALEAGARGYISKNDNPDTLQEAIEKVSAGGIFLTPNMAEKLALATAGIYSDPLRNLSPRERQALDLLGQGKTLSEIANEMGISYRTSAYAVAQIKAKLGITSTAALIKWAADRLILLPANS
jgi:two-component system, NarL family, invasion response regulator UvrY